MQNALIAAAVLLAVFLLHLLARWMESRGWIYWTRSRGHASRAGSAFLELQQILNPSKRHVIEMKRELMRKKERDGSGEPPATSEADSTAPLPDAPPRQKVPRASR